MIQKILKNSFVLALLVSSSLLIGGDFHPLSDKPSITLLSGDLESIKVNKTLQPLFSKWTRYTVFAGAAFAAGIWAKHHYDFYKIDQWLKKSSPKVTNYNYFAFSGWNMHMHSYNTSKDLLKFSKDVKQTLFRELNNKKNKYFKDKNGNAISLKTIMEKYVNSDNPGDNYLVKDPKAFKVDVLQSTFSKEKTDLEKKLNYLAQFTPLPYIISLNATAYFGKPNVDNKSSDNYVLAHCENLITQGDIRSLQQFEDIIDTSKKDVEEHTAFENYLLFRKPILQSQTIEKEKEKEQDPTEEHTTQLPKIIGSYSWNPWYWKIGNSTMATKLYYKCIKRYLRLLALEKIMA